MLADLDPRLRANFAIKEAALWQMPEALMKFASPRANMEIVRKAMPQDSEFLQNRCLTYCPSWESRCYSKRDFELEIQNAGKNSGFMLPVAIQNWKALQNASPELKAYI